MAHTLHPDPALQRFNAAKEKLGHYFRFRPQSAFFNLFAMGAVPAGLFYFAYSMEGLSLSRVFRTDVVLEEEKWPIYSGDVLFKLSWNDMSPDSMFFNTLAELAMFCRHRFVAVLTLRSSGLASVLGNLDDDLRFEMGEWSIGPSCPLEIEDEFGEKFPFAGGPARSTSWNRSESPKSKNLEISSASSSSPSSSYTSMVASVGSVDVVIPENGSACKNSSMVGPGSSAVGPRLNWTYSSIDCVDSCVIVSSSSPSNTAMELFWLWCCADSARGLRWAKLISGSQSACPGTGLSTKVSCKPPWNGAAVSGGKCPPPAMNSGDEWNRSGAMSGVAMWSEFGKLLSLDVNDVGMSSSLRANDFANAVSAPYGVVNGGGDIAGCVWFCVGREDPIWSSRLNARGCSPRGDESYMSREWIGDVGLG